MKHLITIEDLTTEDINQICARTQDFEKGIRKSNHSNAHITNMFFENSTRTKLSFEMAINKINANMLYGLCDGLPPLSVSFFCLSLIKILSKSQAPDLSNNDKNLSIFCDCSTLLV